MGTLTWLAGADDDDTDATVSGLTITANSLLVVTVKVAASTASALGTGTVTDTFTDVGVWTKQAGDEHVNGGSIDPNAKAWVGIFTAQAGSDTTGDITATVTNAGSIRVDVYQFVGTSPTVVGDGADAGDIGVPGTFTVTLDAAPTIDDVTVGALAWHDFTTPSGIEEGNGCEAESEGTVSWSSGTRILRWLDQSRSDSTSDEIEWRFTGGDEYAEAAAAIHLESALPASTFES
jgi:hypothetical protein